MYLKTFWPMVRSVTSTLHIGDPEMRTERLTRATSALVSSVRLAENTVTEFAMSFGSGGFVAKVLPAPDVIVCVVKLGPELMATISPAARSPPVSCTVEAPAETRVATCIHGTRCRGWCMSLGTGTFRPTL